MTKGANVLIRLVVGALLVGFPLLPPDSLRADVVQQEVLYLRCFELVGGWARFDVFANMDSRWLSMETTQTTIGVKLVEVPYIRSTTSGAASDDHGHEVGASNGGGPSYGGNMMLDLYPGSDCDYGNFRTVECIDMSAEIKLGGRATSGSVAFGEPDDLRTTYRYRNVESVQFYFGADVDTSLSDELGTWEISIIIKPCPNDFSSLNYQLRQESALPSTQ
jgi:hypothetical protein